MNNDIHQAVITADQDAQTDVNKFLWVVVGCFGSIIGIVSRTSISQYRLQHVCTKIRKNTLRFIQIRIKSRQEAFNGTMPPWVFASHLF
ncbi:hypothetical protein C6501_10285 [Candidatus Poribacteria bacterium]|nr:MAG: hypothetical protein C6501_10285 [Candidatus Poribacteria bacterium]